MKRHFHALLTGLILIPANTAEADSPRLETALRIDSLRIIGTPTVGSTVQLKMSIISFVSGNATLMLYFPKYIVPVNQLPGEKQRSENIILTAGIRVDKIYQFKVLQDGA